MIMTNGEVGVMIPRFLVYTSKEHRGKAHKWHSCVFPNPYYSGFSFALVKLYVKNIGSKFGIE